MSNPNPAEARLTGTIEASEAVYLTPAEVATLLRLSVKSVYRMAKSDPTMPATKVGGSIRFHRERLELWLRSCEQGTPRMRGQVRALSKVSPSKEGANS